ncbi:MAG TPA: hypothetical protein VG759_18995 [Candidatus Angelobacter sp.]|jgi:hypothetical protein|nr:hypothetical protein [Candidatus Angelobacter sp.]
MKRQRAAIGVRAHSGWAAVVSVFFGSGKVEILDRRIITLIAPGTVGAKQPYHFAENLKLPEAEKFLNDCFRTSVQLALSGLKELMGELLGRNYFVAGTAILRASGRPLPAISNILASHALIHAAEGEFFRDAIGKACENLDLVVTGIRERDLDERLHNEFGQATTRIQQQVSVLGRSLGPPWTTDQKTAALAALAVLAGH